jgi:apolipoprotein D and lipocalin family protein
MRIGLQVIYFTTLLLILAACQGMPEQIKPVQNFELEKYLGKWYEIARLDHSFERGLDNVTAEYSMREDGGVKVRNRGYSVKEQNWDDAVGKAYFVETKDQGYLKVSFFGPFYGSYVVFGLDQSDYQYAFISGPNHSYLWLLSRTPKLAPEIVDQFLQQAQAAGFDTSALIFVKQDKNIPNVDETSIQDMSKKPL